MMLAHLFSLLNPNSRRLRGLLPLQGAMRPYDAVIDLVHGMIACGLISENKLPETSLKLRVWNNLINLIF